MENENFNTNNAERYDSYIENLYQTKNTLRRKDFIERTGWRDFVPVVDDDAARFLQLVLQLKKPLSILEIGTSLGFSTTSMALTAKRYGGKIITVEFDQNVADQAQKISVRQASMMSYRLCREMRRRLFPAFRMRALT